MSLELEKFFRSPAEAAVYALVEWKKQYRRTCACPEGSGLREEADRVECSCGAGIVEYTKMGKR